MNKYGFNFNKTYNPNNFDCFRSYSREQILSLLVGIIDGDGSISTNGSSYTNQITITAHNCWKSFYKNLLEFLEIEGHYNDIENKNTISIRICKREYCLILKRFILNNNLFYLQRKWNKIIEKPAEN